jgi:acyl dehydratase
MAATYRLNDRYISRIIVGEDMRDFAERSGDQNPIHVDYASAQRFGFPRRVAYAGVLLAEISRIIGTQLPGPGALCLSYQFDFMAPVYGEEAVVFETAVAHVSPATGPVLVKFFARREHDGVAALTGSASVKVKPESDE